MDPAEHAAIRAAQDLLFGTASAEEGGGGEAPEPEEIRKAFLRAARRCHPDLARSVGEDEESLTRKFQRLQAAYTTLLDHAEQRSGAVGAPAGDGGRDAGPAAPPTRWSEPVRAAAEDARWGSPGVSMSGAHWIGPVPAKPLRLGRFLYHTGRISREALSEALDWQRSQRPPFGSLAVDLGFLDHIDLGTVLDARRMGERIGRTAVRLGLLSPQMRDWIVSHQQQTQRPIGAYFVERGVLSEQELGAVLREQQSHNDRSPSADAQFRTPIPPPNSTNSPIPHRG